MNKKKIILIGGTAGSGKTSVARELKTDHRLGTGFMREIVKTMFNKDKFPELYEYTFSGTDPIKNLLEQSRLLKPFVLACIDRARREGTSLVIEGNHLIPSLYDKKDYDHFIILDYKNITTNRLCEGTHSKRRLSEKDILGVKDIAKFILKDAIKRNINVLNSDIDFEKLLTDVKRVIYEK